MQKKAVRRGKRSGKQTISPETKRITQAKKIRLLILDVDGVLTSGGIILDNHGNELKKFHVRDGHGIKLIQRAGIEVAIITGRDSQVVEHRARELGIKHVFQKCFNKLTAFEELKTRLSLTDEEVAYVGDDVVDIPVMRRVGFAVAVADAHESIFPFAHYVTSGEGGECAVREVCEHILKAKGLWEGIMHGYLEI